jgi:predicted permease
MAKLVIYFFFPCFIFVNLVSNFDFRSYSNWWIFPFLSFFVTAVGFFTAKLFIRIDKNLEGFKREFVSLVTFQNGGYLPLILVALLLPPGSREEMFIYIFLFLLGFNVIIWSLGVTYLAKSETRRIELKTLFNPPVIAIIAALLFIAVGLRKLIPQFLTGTMEMFGDCALPLAIMTVGANLSFIDISDGDYNKHILKIVLAKLLFIPLLFLGLVLFIKPPYAVALLILLQGAMPSAVTSSIIMRHYDKKDNIVSLGIFWTHIICLITIPAFLILFSSFKDFIYR